MAESSVVRETVRETYAALAKAASQTEGGASCRFSDAVMSTPADSTGVFGSTLYDKAGTSDVPDAAISSSLGCGVPTAVADLQEGETVLDLGSGAGADVFISARRGVQREK